MAAKKTHAYKTQAKRYWMRKRYGISPEMMAEMLDAQGGKCACCGTAEPKTLRGWVIDHDHNDGAIRGILCDACNVGLGRFDDSPEKLEAAIRYLKNHSARMRNGE